MRFIQEGNRIRTFEPYEYDLTIFIIPRRFSAIFRNKGFKKGHSLLAFVGNNNFMYAAYGGAWILGGRVSSGDVSLDSSSIASQVISPA